MNPTPSPALLELAGISKIFGAHTPGRASRTLQALRLMRAPRPARAVDGVSMAVHPSEVVGLVGESGCGKSTLGRIAADLLAPSVGTVSIGGTARDTLPPTARKAARLDIQMVFQDAYASLNPRLRVDQIVGEGALRNGLVQAADYDDYVCQQLQRAGLDPAVRWRYPHQFSGGQRQRINIARALAVRPRLMICDEAIAALDVSIQAQIINLFMDLRASLDLSYLFISHDLSVVRHVSDRVIVMYLGRVVESAPTEALFERPNHPYTRALLDQIPRRDARRTPFRAIEGEIPSPLAPPTGCHFHPRCPHAMPRCRSEIPRLRGIAVRHESACHLNDNA